MSVVHRIQRLNASPRLGHQFYNSHSTRATGFDHLFTPSMGRAPPGVATAIRASHGSPSPVVVRGAAVDTLWVALSSLSVATIAAQHGWTSARGITADDSLAIGAGSRRPTEAGRQTFLRTLAVSPGSGALSLRTSRPDVTPRLGPILGASARAYSTSVRESRVRTLAGQVGPDKIVDLGKVMEILRDLEILDKIKGRPPKSGNGFKESARSLYPLWHLVNESGGLATFKQLEETLDPIQTHAWTAITELLLEGSVTRLDQLNAMDKASLVFLRVFGIAVKYAEKYYKMGARTLKDLESLPLTRAQKIGLRHVNDIDLLIPRSEMESLREKLEECVAAADPRFECAILGSYRRGVDFSSDIDLVVRHKKLKLDDPVLSKELLLKVVGELTAQNLIVEADQLTCGDKKYSGLIKLPGHKHFRRIDIRIAAYDLYAYMQLASSGDALLMKLLRHTAKGKGYTLNEYGMGEKYAKEDENPNGFRPNTLRKVKGEREIFDILGLPYLEPTQRDYTTWKGIYKQAGINLEYVEKL